MYHFGSYSFTLLIGDNYYDDLQVLKILQTLPISTNQR